jgi:hypothetical protein
VQRRSRPRLLRVVILMENALRSPKIGLENHGAPGAMDNVCGGREGACMSSIAVRGKIVSKTGRVAPPFKSKYERPVDAGIRRAVRVLWSNGVETTESCEGGRGHAFSEPTVRFHGGQAEGFRALGIALQNGLKVVELRRYWSVRDGEPVGPHWEMIFSR